MIADTSVLVLLARAGHLDLLDELEGPVRIPEAVRAEAGHAAPELPDAKRIRQAVADGWLTVHEVPDGSLADLGQRHPTLGEGERAVLALADQLDADVVLFDDRLAREAARLEGLHPVGSLGVLARAFHQGTIPSKTRLAEAVRAVLDAGLWVTADVVEAFWAGLGGRP